MDCGIRPELFWESSLNEIIDMMESYVRCQERQRKQKLTDDFILAKVSTLNLAAMLAGKNDFCNPWDFYPQMFQKDKEIYEAQTREAQLADYRKRRRQWADEFNRRRNQGM